MKVLKKKGFTLVEIMIVVAIIALLAAIAIPNLLRAKLSANDALAKSTLRTLSTASEAFATANNGVYPTTISSLMGATPPYVNENYCDSAARNGYTFTCRGLNPGYEFTATPVILNITGTTVFTISTGGVMVP